MRLRGHQLDGFNAALLAGDDARAHQELQTACAKAEGVAPVRVQPVVLPHWFDRWESQIRACAGKPRTGERWTVDPIRHETRIHFVIEVQLHEGGGFHPALMPDGTWFFATAEERDNIFEALVRQNAPHEPCGAKTKDCEHENKQPN